MKRGYRKWIVAGIVVALGAIYAFIDPAASRFMPKCLFHLATGLDCPGCGMQRMLHALLTGDLTGAWNANAFLLCSIPLLVFMLIVDFRRLRNPRLYKIVNSPGMIYAYTAAIVAWGVLRNV